MSSSDHIPIDNSQILIINEDVKLNKYVFSIIKSEKYRIIISEDPEEGLNQIYTKKIDLVILGKITLEGLGTAEFIKRISSNPETKRLPIIVIIPEKQKELGVVALSLGATDYLVTPFNAIEFKIKIRNFISMKLLSESFENSIITEENKKQKIKELENFKAFVVTANHQINQPLAIIKGNFDLIKMLHPNFTTENNKHFEKIDLGISRIVKILNRLKEIDKPEYTGYTESTLMVDIGKLD